MEPLLQLDLQIILLFQQIGAWLTAPMKLFSLLGTEDAFMAVMPLLYWCVDSAIGLRVGLMLLLSNAFNSYLKLAFQSPRPYWYDPHVQGLSTETSFGLPSGHAQNAASIWGLLALEVRRRWRIRSIPILLAVLIGLIGISRLYLGVHFLADVVAGWLVGLVLLWVFARLQPGISRWLSGLPLRQTMVFNLLTAFAMVGVMLFMVNMLRSWQLPAAWLSNAAAAGGDPIDPLSLQGIFTIGGTWLGVTCGAAWYNRRYGQLSTRITMTQRLLRYLVGMAGLWLIYLGLGSIFPRTDDLLGFSLRFIRYTMIGAWVSAAAPLLFRVLGLVPTPGKMSELAKRETMKLEGG